MDTILSYIQSFYTKEEVKKIAQVLSSYIKDLEKVPQQAFTTDWYKNGVIYLLYPESISGEKSPLKNVKDFLPHIKELGCNAFHILPFLQSPMRDKGFDVSNYYKVREGLGGLQDVLELKKEADKLGLQVFMDLVFNHVSNQHEWFVKAQEGDAYYRNFFIHTKEKPKFLKKVYKNSAIYAEYEVEGEKNAVRIIFPEAAGEVPHWVKGKDGYWYYHTFYPEQIDVDWKNPDVFIEFVKVMLYWAQFGFHFRFDAISFIGKAAYKHLSTHNALTHHLITVLHQLAQLVHPQCVFILEADGNLDAEIEYFGTSNYKQANMLYNFRLNAATWASLINETPKYLWHEMQKGKAIPAHARWINFLRNHDELNLASLDHKTMQELKNIMYQYGKSFREGLGIAGRTYSLLGSDERRFLLSYFLLLSLPGGVLIPYGDEFGIENISQSDLNAEEKGDVRNINRGVLTPTVMQSAKGVRIFLQLKQLFEMQTVLHNYFQVWPKEIDTEEGVFGARYIVGSSHLVIFINLTKKHKKIQFDMTGFQEVANVNRVTIEKNEIHLQPYGGVWLQK